MDALKYIVAYIVASMKKNLWTRGQPGYPQVTCRGRVEALGIRIESGRQKVLSVRRLIYNNIHILIPKDINRDEQNTNKGGDQLIGQQLN